MATSRAERTVSFLKGYSQDNVNLIGADPARGKPALFRARTSDGRPMLVKFWAHTNVSNDSDIKDIWRSEIRQLQRLAAVPRADELFITMLTGGSDHEGFYIVLDPGLGVDAQYFNPYRGCSRSSGCW